MSPQQRWLGAEAWAPSHICRQYAPVREAWQRARKSAHEGPRPWAASLIFPVPAPVRVSLVGRGPHQRCLKAGKWLNRAVFDRSHKITCTKPLRGTEYCLMTVVDDLGFQ